MSNDYNGDDRRAPENTSWHLKKEVNVSMILSILGVAVACITGYSDLKKDMALIQADNAVIHQAIVKQEDDVDKVFSTMQAHYERLNAQLDRLIERSQK